MLLEKVASNWKSFTIKKELQKHVVKFVALLLSVRLLTSQHGLKSINKAFGGGVVGLFLHYVYLHFSKRLDIKSKKIGVVQTLPGIWRTPWLWIVITECLLIIMCCLCFSEGHGKLTVFAMKAMLATMCGGKILDKLRCESCLLYSYSTVIILQRRYGYFQEFICCTKCCWLALNANHVVKLLNFFLLNCHYFSIL